MKWIFVLLTLVLAGCGSLPKDTGTQLPTETKPVQSITDAEAKGQEVVLYALTLLETGYRFGGKNPEAGIDCSGLVTYVYKNAIDMRISGNAAMLAKKGRYVDKEDLKAGDLVFFNTLGRPYSHVGIYIGKNRFVHALNAKSGVRMDYLTNKYYATRYEEARRLL